VSRFSPFTFSKMNAFGFSSRTGRTAYARETSRLDGLVGDVKEAVPVAPPGVSSSTGVAPENVFWQCCDETRTKWLLR
jgi:hypothetical protein